MNAAEIIARFGLAPHPEGGWYREIYRSPMRVAGPKGERSALTTIYYLLEQADKSCWHVVASDEIWHFYAGAVLQLYAYDPHTRELDTHELGAERLPVAIIPARTWQAARSTGAYSFVGCSVGPGFDFRDFQLVHELAGHEQHFTGAMSALRALL
ncbi:MAG TPA: cupin domain-containing protein [Steroidobacteraceae bacterium]|nr:cupin domain-containing protein [Steroidobacteraceae bacterium]